MRLPVFAIRNIVGIFSGLKLHKISDNEVKDILLKDYLAFRKFVKSIDEDKQELVNKFQDDWKEEINCIRTLRNEKKDVDGFDDYFKAESEANAILLKMEESEFEVDVKSVKMDKFISATTEIDISFEQIALLEDNGIVEE